jgi:hypothetical protein
MPSASELKLFATMAGDAIDLDQFNEYAAQVQPTVNRVSAPGNNAQQHSTVSEAQRPPQQQRQFQHVPVQQSHQGGFDGGGADQLPRPPPPPVGGGEEHNVFDRGYQEYSGDVSVAERHALLNELTQLEVLHPETKHPDSTRRFTLETPVQDVVFELSRRHSLLDISSNMTIVKGGFGAGCFVTQLFFGKFLKILPEGWAKQCVNDIDRFQPSLLKGYRQIFRRGGSFPWYLTLLMGVGMHAVEYTSKNGGSSQPYVTTADQQGVNYTTSRTAPEMTFEEHETDEDEMDMPSDDLPAESPINTNSDSGLQHLLPMLVGM